LGYCEDEILGIEWSVTFVPDKMRTEAKAVFEDLLSENTKAPVYNDIPVLTKSGNEKIISWHHTVVRDSMNSIIGTLSSGKDITEQMALEQQLRQSQRMEAIGRLTGGIAHDFNNMLTVILGYSDILIKSSKIDLSVQKHAEEINKAAQKASSLIKQLLAFSRKQLLQPKIFDINDLISGIQKMIQSLIGEDVDLVFSPEPEIGTIKADPVQIEQVLMNLIVNARDAMPHGGKLAINTVNLNINTEYNTRQFSIKPGKYVTLTVSDTGTGMEEETQTKIFEPFYTTKETGKGTGLGLSTVYGIVKQSGGFIEVRSEPGRGTSFIIYLPRAG
jgi:PAS domain S-box-containing protein